MTVRTENSTYRIVPMGDFFMVKKIAETKPNPNGIDLGWTHICKHIEVELGKPAWFGRFRTSYVLEVQS